MDEPPILMDKTIVWRTNYYQKAAAFVLTQLEVIHDLFDVDNMNTIYLHSTSRSRAAVARRAHNPKVAGSIPAFATSHPGSAGVFLCNT
jgi:hypothetical protein